MASLVSDEFKLKKTVLTNSTKLPAFSNVSIVLVKVAGSGLLTMLSISASPNFIPSLIAGK